MPKESVTFNGFIGGINYDASESDIVSQGQGEDECVEARNVATDIRGKVKFKVPATSGGIGDTAGTNDVTAEKTLTYGSETYLNQGVYKVGQNINWSAKGDYVVPHPTVGSLNPTNMSSQKDGVDISLIADRGDDLILFLGATAANNPYNKGVFMDQIGYFNIDSDPIGLASGSYGPSDFIYAFFDKDNDGILGDDVQYWTYSSASSDPLSTNPTSADHSVSLKDSGGSYTDYSLAGTSGNLDVSKLDQLELWHRATDDDTCVFAGFRVGDGDLDQNDDALNGGYGKSFPSPDKMDIVLELKCNTGYDSNFDGIYIIYDSQDKNQAINYATNTLDKSSKMWKIENSVITSAGADSDYARITVPWESAFHTGSSFSVGDINHIYVGWVCTGTSSYNTGDPKVSIKEISMIPSNKVYNWATSDVRLSQTRIKNEVESIATVYTGKYIKNSNAATLTIQRPDNTHGPDGGNIYYEELDNSEAPDGDKILLATWDKTKGVKKVGNDTYNAWSSTVYTDLVQNGTDFASNWTVRSADDGGTSDGDGWTLTGGAYSSDNDEHASIIGALASSMKAGEKYQLKFEIESATLNLTIGGGDATGSGNIFQETLVAAQDYAEGIHTVEFTVGSTDRTHLWIYVDHDAPNSALGDIDDVSLFAMPQVAITYEDPPLGSTYLLESGYPDDTETINALFKASAVVGRQVYIGNVAEEINHETLDTSAINLNFQSPTAAKMRRASGNWETAGFTSATGFVLIQDATDAGNNILHTAGAISNGAGTKDDWAMSASFAGSTNETSKQVKITQFGAYDGSKILKAGVGKTAGFSDLEYIDLELGGETISVMETSGDRLFVFSESQCLIINVAQDVEFMEATMAGYGVTHHRQVTKVGEGIAWVNQNGVYFFNGQEMTNLSQDRFKTFGWGSSCAIVYHPDTEELIVWTSTQDSAHTTSGDSAAYCYCLTTKSWVSYRPNIHTKPSTNSSIKVVSGNLLPTYYSSDGSGYYKVTQGGGADNDVAFKTGKIGFGNLAQRKKIHKVIVRGKELDNIRIKYWTDLVSDQTLGTCTNTAGSTVGEDEFKLSGVIGKWFQLRFESNGTTNSDGEIEDISIIYRRKNLK